MNYVRLGNTGIEVSRICLGTAFRAYWHGHIDEKTCLEVIQRAVDSGCNFFRSLRSFRCCEPSSKASIGCSPLLDSAR
jgi:predicted aldo/keto reductase-like oxidoreductase